jgi:formate hydrogenlyase subunit 6/NADH:ubiquinone oxidoreductase subunit I
MAVVRHYPGLDLALAMRIPGGVDVRTESPIDGIIEANQSECILCEGCVDICPWKCIHMVTPEAVAEAEGTEKPGEDPQDRVVFVIDDDICTRCTPTAARRA